MIFKKRLIHNEPKLDVAPFADIVFLLLIFFMLSSTLVVEPGIKLKLPKTKTSEIQEKEKIILSIDKDNSIYINKRKISKDNLEQELVALSASRQDRSLIIRADKDVSHGFVVETLDKAKLAGFEKLSIATEKKQ